MGIKRILKNKSKQKFTAHPVIFDLGRISDRRKFGALIKSSGIKIVDDFKEQLRELFAINNPTLAYTSELVEAFEKEYRAAVSKKDEYLMGKWVYYPWLDTLVHLLGEKDFQAVRTARNRNLITAAEQKKFYESKIGIAGLSVGNSALLAIVLQGGGGNLHIADFDSLSLSNLNRIRGSVTELGSSKTDMTLRQIYLLNPYAKIKIFDRGLSEKNIEEFFRGLSIVIDEIDNIAVKLLIRKYAKKHKIPVVMAADDGDNGVVDVERYDLNPKTKFFHGRLGDVTVEKLKKLTHFEIGKTITKHIGPENITPSMVDSLLAMGKTIVSWPQLGGAATLNGAAVSFCVRRILNGQSVVKNRAILSLDEVLTENYNTLAEKKKRVAASKKLKQIFGL